MLMRFSAWNMIAQRNPFWLSGALGFTSYLLHSRYTVSSIVGDVPMNQSDKCANVLFYTPY